MGCGCKGDKKAPKLLKKTGGSDLKLEGKLLKIPTAILMTIGIILLSPFLLIMIWVIAIKSIFGQNSDIINMMLAGFQKKEKEIPEEELNESHLEAKYKFGDFEGDQYKIVNVDIIKK